MRLAILHPHFAFPGGAENLLVWLATGLAQRGHEVTLISRKNHLSIWEEALHPNLAAIQIPQNAIQNRSKALQSYVAGRFLRTILPRFDIVCASNFPSYWWLQSALKRANSPLPAIWYCHEPSRITYASITDDITLNYLSSGSRTLPNHQELARRLRKRLRQERVRRRTRFHRDKQAMAAFSGILANSHFTAEKIKAIWGQTSVVCYPGIPERTDLSPVPVSRRRDIVFLSSFALRKNVMGVLAAFSHIVNGPNRREMVLHLVGWDTQQHRAVAGFIREHDLSARVRSHGFLGEQEKSDLLSSARLCVFVPFCEPFGLVTLEALSHGTPVIVSDHGGPAEVITNGVTGMHVNPYDPHSISRGILTLYDDMHTLEAMSKAGTALVRERFTLGHFITRFEATAAELLETHRSGSAQDPGPHP